MASTSRALKISNGGGDIVELFDPENNLKANYGMDIVDGQMENDSKPTSFYVVYDQIDYGKSEGVSTKAALVPPQPLSGSSEMVRFGFVAQSVQGFDNRDPGIILFEHPGYKGNAKQFRTTRKDITAGLPAKYWDGASSFIITGGKWKLYGRKNLKPPTLTVGGQSILGPGLYGDEVSFDDKVQSVERVVD